MNKLPGTTVCVLACVYASFAFAQTPAAPPDLGSADWSVKQAQSLNAQPKDAIWKFMGGAVGKCASLPSRNRAELLMAAGSRGSE